MTKILKKMFIINTILILLGFSTVYSQIQWSWNWHNSGGGNIGNFQLSNFNVLTHGSFIYNDFNTQSSVLFHYNGCCENKLIIYYENEWQEWGPGTFQGTWQYDNNDRFNLIGNFLFHYYESNLLFAVNNSGTAKVIGPPRDPQHSWWEVTWSNNGNGYIGDPSWDVRTLSIYKYYPGFYSSDHTWNVAQGQEILSIDNDGFAAVLKFTLNDQTNTGTWSRTWWNNYNNTLGPWPYLDASDRIVVGNFDGTGHDEILIYNYSQPGNFTTFKRAMVLRFVDGNWLKIWDNNKSGWIGGWQMPIGNFNVVAMSGDLYYTYDSKRELMIIDRQNGKAIMQKFTGTGGGWDVVYNNNSSGWIGGSWNIKSNDEFYVNYFDLDPWTNCNNGWGAKLLAVNKPYWSMLLCPRVITQGCPWLFVYNSDTTGFQPDNNILHRSEFPENSGIDLLDRYKLNINPQPIDNQIYIQVAETEKDYNYLDNVKLYAVDHPAGTVVGVTENNDIVMFEVTSVESSDDAMLNGSDKITSYIQYNLPGKKTVSGVQGDSIYAHFDSTGQLKKINNLHKKYYKTDSNPVQDSLAIISEIGDRIYPVLATKDYAGDVTIHTTTESYNKIFTRREKSSTVIIPFSADLYEAVDYIDVNWYDLYSVEYFSVVPLMYSGFDLQELSLAEATHSIYGDIITQLNDVDMNYAELDSSEVITLKFNCIGDPQEGYIRDYVFETKGRYVVPGTSYSTPLQKGSNNLNNLPKKFKLYYNYPNPFNPITKIKYDLPKNVNVTMKIFDLLGREIATLINNQLEITGTHEIEWNASQFASGVYLYRIEAGTFTDVKKMVLMK